MALPAPTEAAREAIAIAQQGQHSHQVEAQRLPGPVPPSASTTARAPLAVSLIQRVGRYFGLLTPATAPATR